jgi:hypothetical protein
MRASRAGKISVHVIEQSDVHGSLMNLRALFRCDESSLIQWALLERQHLLRALSWPWTLFARRVFDDAYAFDSDECTAGDHLVEDR